MTFTNVSVRQTSKIDPCPETCHISSMKTELDTLVKLLDDTLETAKFKDVSHNGLQLANSGTLTRVVTGVDASLRLLQAAAECGADCVVCHHGLSWGDSLARITGVNHRLVSFAMANNIAVYASHLPLDAHPLYGNNAQICKALQLVKLKPSFEYHGQTIGFTAETRQPEHLETLLNTIRAKVTPEIRVVTFGKKTIKSVGIVSGGAADMADQAAAMGADLFLTGEPSLLAYNLAEHHGLNVVFAGHYATETFGVRALARLITQKLKLPAQFIDFKIEY